MQKKRLCVLCALYAAFAVVSCSTVAIREYDVESTAIKSIYEEKPPCIVHISDFHSNDFGKEEAELLEKIRKINPSAVFMTGDMFDFKMKGCKPVGNMRFLLRGLQNMEVPFFYVSGNHEYDLNHDNEYASLISEYGGRIVQNDVVCFYMPETDCVLLIAGVNDPYEDMAEQERKKKLENKEAYAQKLKKVSMQRDAMIKQSGNKSKTITVLLAHRPEYIEDYLLYGYDIILSGHAHGGQWRIPFAKNGLYAPGQGVFPRYSGGRFDFTNGSGSTAFIVNRGLSYQRPFFPRIFNNPELVVITLSPKK